MWSDVIKNNKKYHLHIELTSKCNAACPHCPRFLRGAPIRNPAIGLYELKLEEVKQWIPVEIIESTGSMNICGNFGDPSLCLEMVDIVEYFISTNPKIDIEIRTNGGARNSKFWRDLGKLSKKYKNQITTIFSIDGLEDTNHLYRRNVKWDKLMSNVKSYISAGGKAAWEYLIFKHNEHQIKDAEELKKEIGFEFISFKQPIGFEDYLNNRTIPLPVYDKKGKLDYFLEPSSRFKNSNLKYQDNKDEVSKSLMESDKSCSIDPNGVNFDLYSKIETHDIKCQAVHDNGHIEIYIDSNGNVRPCCHIGVETERHIELPLGTHSNLILSPPHLFNLKTNSLERILKLFDIRIEGTWNKTHREGRCIKCSSQCGKTSETQSNRLYVKQDPSLKDKTIL